MISHWNLTKYTYLNKDTNALNYIFFCRQYAKYDIIIFAWDKRLWLDNVMWCPLGFLHKNDVGSSLPPVVCRKASVLSMSFVFLGQSGVKHVVHMWVSYKRQDQELRDHLDSFPFFLWGTHYLPFLAFCFAFFVLLVFVLCLMYPMLPLFLDFTFLNASSVFSNIYLYSPPYILT